LSPPSFLSNHQINLISIIKYDKIFTATNYELLQNYKNANGNMDLFDFSVVY